MNTHNRFWMVVGIGCFAACLAFARNSLASETQHENFDRDPVAGWEFSCEKRFVPAGEGRFLQVLGGGHALSVLEREDFLLTFRYRSKSAGGVGDILFRAGEQGAYSLRLEPQQIVLCWRSGNHEVGFQEQDLAVKPYPLQPDTWHTLGLRVQGNRIDVSVGGKPLISCSDPQQRPAGMVGLGVVATMARLTTTTLPSPLPVQPQGCPRPCRPTSRQFQPSHRAPALSAPTWPSRIFTPRASARARSGFGLPIEGRRGSYSNRSG